MPALKPGTIIPSDAEDADITAAAASDPDNPILTDDMIERAVRRGRPPVARKKKPVALRLDAETVDFFKSLGAGWHTKINDILGEYARTHR